MAQYQILERSGPLALVGLTLGPLLMSVGDLMHPAEDEDAAAQVAIIAGDAANWHLAHMLLFLGGVIFIPGILALTSLVAADRPRAAYASRVMLLAGFAAFLAIFGFEMLVGQLVLSGADPASATQLIEAFVSLRVLGVFLLAGLFFFVGTAILAGAMVRSGGWTRTPGVIFGLGVAVILVQIASSQVLLSQIGNILILISGLWFAYGIRRGSGGSAPEPQSR